MTEDAGATPVEAMERIDSEVRHLRERLKEDREDVRDRFTAIADWQQRFEARVMDLQSTLAGLVRDVAGLQRLTVWALGVGGGLMLTLLGLVLGGRIAR